MRVAWPFVLVNSEPRGAELLLPQTHSNVRALFSSITTRLGTTTSLETARLETAGLESTECIRETIDWFHWIQRARV